MIRKTRGPQKFAGVTYKQIAEWTGLTLHTVRSYASRGEFDPHKLESVLQWVNARRAKHDLPPIGQPAEDTPENSELDTLETGTNSLTAVIPSGYNPLTGEFDHE